MPFALATAAGAQASSSPDLVSPPRYVRSGHIGKAPGQLLDKFHRQLSELRAGRVARVTVLQIGDSHTEADHFSGRLRGLLQARFGDAGRGMLPPGSPFAYWRPYQVRAQQSGAWQVLSSNKRDYAPLPFGLSGIIARGGDPNDAMSLEIASESAAFDAVEVGYYRKPAGGTITVTVDGKTVGEIDTRGDTYGMGRRVFALPSPGRRLDIRPLGNGSVDIADWTLRRNNPGVVLTSHGFSGAQVGIMERWDWPTVASQLSALDPALILLAFGTNEGYAPKERLENYETQLEIRIRALQAAAPKASIILVAGPDANLIPKFCNLTPQQRDRQVCRPLSSREIANYDAMLARSDPGLCRWHTPGSYSLVREAQRAVAHRTGVGYWDWLEVQGGLCAAHRWELQGLVHKDRVHMKMEGYWRSADQLYAMLMRGFRER